MTPSRTDDVLEAAVFALRETPIPSGPPAAVLAAAAALGDGPATVPGPWFRFRRPLVRLVAAAAVLAALGLAVGRYGLGGGVAFADVAAHFRQARTLFFRLTVTAEARPAVTMKYTLAAPSSLRLRTGGPADAVLTFDLTRSEGLVLLPGTKQAIKLTSADGLPDGAAPVAEMIRSLREFAQDSVDDLGPRAIDGKPAVGFRVRRQGQAFDVWADPKTRAPVRVEATLTLLGQSAKAVLDEFAFDGELDPALFSLVPPAGYTVVAAGNVEIKEPGEQDLVYLLREIATRAGGRFPDTLDAAALQAAYKDEPKPKDRGAMLGPTLKLTRALLFIHFRQAGDGWRYAGKGVRLGDAARVVAAWKKPGGGWRAVYGDLSVRDVDASAVSGAGK
jgi:outer membrane lipoprotein-sorting protein